MVGFVIGRVAHGGGRITTFTLVLSFILEPHRNVLRLPENQYPSVSSFNNNKSRPHAHPSLFGQRLPLIPAWMR